MKGEIVDVGVQFQEGQLRRFMELDHLRGREPSKHLERERFAAAHPEYFDFSMVKGIVGDIAAVVPNDDGFRRFDPQFVYRYLKLLALTLGQLVTVAAGSHLVLADNLRA